MDRISNLPDNIVEMILMPLPLRDAVRTSILSHQWRYKWITLPKLTFNKKCILDGKFIADEIYRELMKIIYQVLLRHRGPITTFMLSIPSTTDIDTVLHFLSENGIRELTLEAWKGYYKLPSCFFMFKELTQLKLQGCRFISPASFKGFHLLTTLNLQRVMISDIMIEILVSSCPKLNTLILKWIYGCERLRILAPMLCCLTIDVDFKDLFFGSAQFLATLSIKLPISDEDMDNEDYKLVHIFDSFPRIQKLELYGGAVHGLSNGDVPLKFRIACRLEYLSMDLNFEDEQDMIAALSIFRSSPNLQKLSLKASEESTSGEIPHNFWKSEKNFNCLFHHLRIIELKSFIGTLSEVGFVEFILANAPVLKTLHIPLDFDQKSKPDPFLEMNGFRRASSKARVVFDACCFH